MSAPPEYPSPPDFLETDGLLADLQGHSVRSGAIRMAAQALQAVVAIGTGIVMARLLTPADFGVYAMGYTLIGFVLWFRDFGLPLALTQRSTLTESEIRALFAVSVKLTLGLVLFVGAMSPAVALFYGDGRVRAVVWAMAAGVFALGLSSIYEGILIRRMRFAALALIETIGGFASAALGLTAAFLGAGYWALAIQFLGLSMAKGVGVWLASGLKRRSPVSGTAADVETDDEPDEPDEDPSDAVRSMLKYGRELTVTRILHYFGMHADQILVGYAHGSGPLGLYENSLRWSRYPMRQVFLPLQNVVVSTLSLVQHDPRRYRNAFRKGTLAIHTAIVPMLAYLAVDAPNVIHALLGGQWLDAVTLFRLLAVGAIAHAARRATSWLYASEGRTDRQLRWTTVAAPLQIAAVVIGLRWGVEGVAAAFAISAWVLFLPEIAYCVKGSRVRLRDFWHTSWRPGVAALAASAALVALWPALTSNAPVAATELGSLRGVFVRLPVFGGAYVATWVALPGGFAAGRDVADLLRRLRGAGRRGTGGSDS